MSSIFISQENIVVTSSKIKHAYLSAMKEVRCILTALILTKLTKDIHAFVAAYIKARSGANSVKKKRRYSSRYGGGAGGAGASEEEDEAEVDDQSSDEVLTSAALGEIVRVLELSCSFLDRDGNEITFTECTVSAFASHVTNHVLSSGKDMYAHGIDIHDNLQYFDDVDENTRQSIKYVHVVAVVTYIFFPFLITVCKA